jgi:molecular chaperone GrpE
LTPDAVAAVLADFHNWLTDLTTEDEASGACQRPGEAIDLHTLLGQFLAVRQEVNLQTRAVRAQQEQNAETLRQLAAALDALQQSQMRTEQFQRQAREEAIRPLLKTLIDLYDALTLAGREMQRMSETVQPALEQLAAATTAEPEPPAVAPAPRPFWRSLLYLFHPELKMIAENERRAAQRQQEWEKQQERARLAGASSERARQMLASLVTGYTMSVQRVERALRQHGLEAIATVGQRFDPERMEVVEAVIDSGRPAGEVIEEVRRGYLWDGRVFRYAQVRVAKG